jgi:hypothetical protein
MDLESGRTPVNTKAKVAFVASLAVTAAGLIVLAGSTTQSMTQLVAIVTVLLAEFAVAATAYFGLEEMHWFSSKREARWLARGLALTARIVSVAGILLVSLFTYVTARVELQ